MKTGIFFLTLMILVGMSWQSWGQSPAVRAAAWDPAPGAECMTPKRRSRSRAR
jgi:hypothetical protein